KVPLGSEASIVPNGFFGDVAIALRPKAPNPESFEPGDTVPAVPGAAGLQVLASRADTLSLTAQAILGATRTQLVDSGGLQEMRTMLAASNRLVAQLSGVVSAQSRQLDVTLGSVRSRVAALDSAQIDSAVRALHDASANFAAVSSELKQTSAQLNGLIARIDSGGGTAGKLLNDEKLYASMVSLVSRVDSVMLDFRKNPRRYINLSIF
ncbi:MAG: hypothetical protein ACT4R6_03295, partial [Gemmatimonadaceae bacterium]